MSSFLNYLGDLEVVTGTPNPVANVHRAFVPVTPPKVLKPPTTVANIYKLMGRPMPLTVFGKRKFKSTKRNTRYGKYAKKTGLKTARIRHGKSRRRAVS